MYGPFKIFFEQEINRFQKAHPGRIINQYDVAKLFSPAYLKSATPNNDIKGFQSTGIWPTNKDIWGEEDYAPSSTTMTDRNTSDQQETVIDSNSQDVEITIDIEKLSTSGLQSQLLQIGVEPLEQIQREFIENVNVEVEDAVENSIMGIESVSNKKQIHSRDTLPSIRVKLSDKDPLHAMLL